MAENEDDKESGGFLRGLKSLIVEETPDSGKESSRAQTTERPVATQRTAPVVSPGGSAPDPQVRALLDKYVQEAALPAFSAYNESMTNLAGVVPDEGMRIKAALKTLPKGAGLQEVLTDVDECVEVIEKKERETAQTAEKLIKERVGAKEAELAATRGDIEAKKAQIAELQKEIGQLEADATRTQTEIHAERKEIDETQRKFAATAAAYRAELAKQKEKITQYGKGA